MTQLFLFVLKQPADPLAQLFFPDRLQKLFLDIVNPGSGLPLIPPPHWRFPIDDDVLGNIWFLRPLVTLRQCLANPRSS